MKFKKKHKEKKRPKNRLFARENKLMITTGDVGGGMGEIGEGD